MSTLDQHEAQIGLADENDNKDLPYQVDQVLVQHRKLSLLQTSKGSEYKVWGAGRTELLGPRFFQSVD